jgi:hypothetical protein
MPQRRTNLDVGELVVELEKMETIKKEIARSESFISWPGVVGLYTGSLPLHNHELCVALIRANKGNKKCPGIDQLRLVAKLLLEVFMVQKTPQNIHINAWGLKRMYATSYRKVTRGQSPREPWLQFVP